MPSPFIRIIFVLIFIGWGIKAAIAQQGTVNAPTNNAPFQVRQEGGRWWLVTPAGKRFFSSGVCCITPGASWLDYDPKKPEYAAWRQYPNPVDWADETLTRLKSWGFTTIGGWSDDSTLKRSSKMDMPYTLVLHMGSSAGAPWLDMWDPKIIAVMDDVAKKQIEPVRNDPRLLGYYTDNEMGWWNGALFQMTLEQPPTSGQRQRLLAMLRKDYGGDWTKLSRDFVPEGAASFIELDRHGKLFLRPGGQGMPEIQRFVGMAAERYYTLCKQIIRKYDPRGLILGDRYQSFTYPEVARASHGLVDVVSTNLNPGWLDGSFPRYYLGTLHALSGEPVMVGEFYMTSTENRSGNKNDSSGFPVVPTQKARAASFTRTLTDLLKLPYVVGADWFQYYDEPTFGRGDGENYDMGLVDINDRPYEALTAASAAIDREALHATAGTKQPEARGGVPPAPKDPLANWKPMQALGDWDRERGFVPTSTRFPMADLYLCWDRDAVYVGLYATDIIEESVYKDKHVPEADRAVWTLNLPGSSSPVEVRLGAGRPPVVNRSGIQIVDLSGVLHDVRNIVAIRLPAALFGKQRFQAGDTLSLNTTFVSWARTYHIEWAGNYTLAK